jgi:hypothetical protein
MKVSLMLPGARPKRLGDQLARRSGWKSWPSRQAPPPRKARAKAKIGAYLGVIAPVTAIPISIVSPEFVGVSGICNLKI